MQKSEPFFNIDQQEGKLKAVTARVEDMELKINLLMQGQTLILNRINQKDKQNEQTKSS